MSDEISVFIRRWQEILKRISLSPLADRFWSFGSILSSKQDGNSNRQDQHHTCVLGQGNKKMRTKVLEISNSPTLRKHTNNNLNHDDKNRFPGVILSLNVLSSFSVGLLLVYIFCARDVYTAATTSSRE
jgi:hypothetical protein